MLGGVLINGIVGEVIGILVGFWVTVWIFPMGIAVTFVVGWVALRPVDSVVIIGKPGIRKEIQEVASQSITNWEK